MDRFRIIRVRIWDKTRQNSAFCLIFVNTVEKRIIGDYAPVGTGLSNWTLFVRIGGTRSLGLAFNE